MTENEHTANNPTGALELHAKYVSNIKRATNELLSQKAIPPDKAPLALGLKPLSIAVPPMLETALGYKGQLRYVAFLYSPSQAVPVHTDGGDDLPAPNPNDWTTFVSHPSVCSHLDQYSTLFGRIGTRPLLTPEEFQELEDGQRLGYCSRFHALVLDRQERILYVAGWQSFKIFQPYSEPDGDEVHRQIESGLLVSPGDEDFSIPPATVVVNELFAWLDNQLSDSDTQENLARWHIHHGRPDEGARILKAILERDPDRRANPMFQYELAFLFKQSHDYEAALDALERCSRNVRIDPYNRFIMASLYVEVKRFEEALHQLELADESYQLKAGDWYTLKARALAGRGEYHQAAELCNDVILNPPSEDVSLSAAEIHLELAGIMALQQQYATAALECYAALDKGFMDPESEMEESIAVYRPAWWLSTEARLRNAARWFEKATRTDSRDEANVGLGYLYLGMGRYSDAEDSFRRAIAFDSSPEVLWFCGVSALATKQKNRAEITFQEFVNRFPGDERGFVGLALCQAAEGLIDKAFEYCDRASTVRASGGELHALLAFLYWSQGSYSDASREARVANAAGFDVHYVLTEAPNDHSKSLRFLDREGEQERLKRLAFA